MVITRVSPLTGEVNKMDINVTVEQLQRYGKGELLQNAFPHLTPAEREFIKTGYTQKDWDMMFGPLP